MKAQYVFATYETACEINHLEQYQEILGEFLKFFDIWHLLCSLVMQCLQKVSGEIGVHFMAFRTLGEIPFPCSTFILVISDTI